WFALPFAAFSVSDYKLPQYVYALTPAVALLCAPWLCEASAAAARGLRWWIAAPAAGGAVGGAAALAFVAGWSADRAVVGAAAGVVGFGAAAFLARRAAPAVRAAAHGAVCLLGASLVWQLWLGPLVVSFQGGAALGALARREDPDGVELPFVETQATHAAAYYANRTAAFRTLAETATLVHQGQTQLAVIDPAAPPRWEDAALEATELERFPSFPTSRPSRAFLDARSRPEVLGARALVRLRELPVR
ncbi:MAG: hypothetical protein K1X89_28325, partial [Myxococcaceae bacterium]|nr:hypothetical protein [Myxococcaceae bacterium]